jgi:hypothetical protein
VAPYHDIPVAAREVVILGRGLTSGGRWPVLYTTSADAGGEKAADQPARPARARVKLVVVGGAADSGYWSGVSRPPAASSRRPASPRSAPALEQVASTLRGRYVITVPTPAHLPARMTIRVGAGKVSLADETVVPAPQRRLAGVGWAPCLWGSWS